MTCCSSELLSIAATHIFQHPELFDENKNEEDDE